mmetsp:Transcript_11305/g.34605  ORF Transcript_11305/g.34605 Transcript_11305/m.34605 type:complete len:281 (-) Transcript_11305:1453-2295(-)
MQGCPRPHFMHWGPRAKLVHRCSGAVLVHGCSGAGSKSTIPMGSARPKTSRETTTETAATTTTTKTTTIVWSHARAILWNHGIPANSNDFTNAFKLHTHGVVGRIYRASCISLEWARLDLHFLPHDWVPASASTVSAPSHATAVLWSHKWMPCRAPNATKRSHTTHSRVVALHDATSRRHDENAAVTRLIRSLKKYEVVCHVFDGSMSLGMRSLDNTYSIANGYRMSRVVNSSVAAVAHTRLNFLQGPYSRLSIGVEQGNIILGDLDDNALGPRIAVQTD